MSIKVRRNNYRNRRFWNYIWACWFRGTSDAAGEGEVSHRGWSMAMMLPRWALRGDCRLWRGVSRKGLTKAAALRCRHAVVERAMALDSNARVSPSWVINSGRCCILGARHSHCAGAASAPALAFCRHFERALVLPAKGWRNTALKLDQRLCLISFFFSPTLTLLCVTN